MTLSHVFDLLCYTSEKKKIHLYGHKRGEVQYSLTGAADRIQGRCAVNTIIYIYFFKQNKYRLFLETLQFTIINRIMHSS